MFNSLVVLGTGTGTQVVLKYIFRVLVLVLVHACKVLVLVLVLEPSTTGNGTGTCNKVLVSKKKITIKHYIFEMQQIASTIRSRLGVLET